MNIRDAKEQIKNAMTAYFTKDKYGNYVIPIHKQRPVFLMGPPGIGKTAIMEQIASEMGVGLLSYSMTHHTRQSALGLPFIEHRVYQGEEFDISEYTMSEIIASVYELMENTGIREGILFLDEINCVSETLTPIMLQFLQYKVFGRHKVPDGWIVVTAGNPPEYNNSVREFDIVTWDRLKRIDCEPDLEVWKEYAHKTGIHPSVLTYLDIKRSDFYKVESTVEGKTFVTARGWDDLSQMIILYEQNDISVDERLIGQYLQNPKIARDFAAYYDLFNKYRSDYQVDAILDGNTSEAIMKRAKEAPFDERLSILSLIQEAVASQAKDVMSMDAVLKKLMATLKLYKKHLESENSRPADILSDLIEAKRSEMEKKKKAGSISSDDIALVMDEIFILKGQLEAAAGRSQSDPSAAFAAARADFEKQKQLLRQKADLAGEKFTNAFLFLDEAFGDGQEMFIFVTELTSGCHTSGFIARYGCSEYSKHNKNLLFFEKQQDIDSVLKELEL